LINRTLVRALITSVALVATGVLMAGCDTDEISLATNAKANQPVPPKLIQAMVEKDMDLQSPILVRLFKQEAELEVWKQNRSGKFEILKTYPICRWSGDLGPKVREGDRQAPEGFYAITPGLMNPQSAYYLSFNTGYPNAYDASLGHTGSQLMVHGDCSSRGCYAMTDDQIGEIYALARESFFGGQRAFQVQAYPFRMTAANFAKHRNNPNIPFWRMLKEGSDQFELTHQEPTVDVCEKRYVFNAQPPQNATPVPSNGIKVGTPWGGFRDQTQAASLKFNPTGKCPAYEVPADVVAALKEKQRQDNLQIAALSTRVTAAPIKTGRDGGMHPSFLAKLKPQEVREPDGTVRYVVDEGAAKKLGSYVNPPLETHPVDTEPTGTAIASAPAPKPQAGGSTYMTAAAESKPAPAPTRTAYAATSSDTGGFFGKVKNFFVGDDEKPATAARVASAPSKSAPKPAPKPHPAPAAAAARPQPAAQPEPEQAAQVTPAPTPARQPAASGASLMSGAQPTVPAGNFDQRWGAIR